MSRRKSKGEKRNRRGKGRHGREKDSPKARARGLAQVRGMVLQFFRSEPKGVFGAKEVAHAIGADGETALNLVHEAMSLLAKERVLKPARTAGKYIFEARAHRQEGIFRRKAGRGHNMFFPEDGGDPIRVAERNSAHAMDGDKVEIQMLANRRGHVPEAEVIRVIERVEANFVGVLSISNDVAFLLTESNKLANDIFIPNNKLNGAKDGEKVLVRVLEWPERAKNPVGEVLTVLGKPLDNDTEMHAILAEFGLPFSYPEEVEDYANNLDESVAYSEKYEREDFREVCTFTIDPEDAKDFDDALSVRELEKGLWEVGVHIADVSAFVQPGDVIDEEATRRATSIYLVDRTIPMLPERLSNDLCSLMPHKDRAAYSVIFKMNSDAEVKEYRIHRSLIHSDCRFTYEQAQEIIEGKDHDLAEEVRLLDGLAKKLRAERKRQGAIEFDRAELAFRLDDAGKPLEVYVKESTDANKLIEEFMLLANRTVAQHIQNIGGVNKEPPTFVYRVHDQPEPDKLEHLAEFVGRIGYKVHYTGTPDQVAASLNALLAKVQGTPEENLIETLVIRTMSKAVYQTDNIGHYGLAFPYYTHFTSPIRRHPDLMVHRLLTRYLAGGKSVPRGEMEEICRHDSEMERLAIEADRASVKYKQVEYMQQHLGEVFDGVISSVKEFGIFVELNANGCEGLVPIRDLDDDFYEFDERTLSLIGYNHKRRYSLGDDITVRVARADLERKQLDFIPV